MVMLRWLFSLETSLWVIGVAVGGGLTVALAPTLRNVRLAHFFFLIAAMWALGSTFEWLVSGEIPMKYIFAFIVGGGIFALAVAAFTWVEGNHAEQLAAQSPGDSSSGASPSAPSHPTSGNGQSTKPELTRKQSGANNTQQQRNSGRTNVEQQSSGNNSPNISQVGPCNIAQIGNNNSATVNCAPPSGTELAKFGAGTVVQLVSDADSHGAFNPIATGFWLNDKGYIATCLRSLQGHSRIGAFVPMPPLLGQNMTVASAGMTTLVEPIVSDKEAGIAILHVIHSPFERSLHGFALAQPLDDKGQNVGEPEGTQEQYWVPTIAKELAQSGDDIIRVAFTEQGGMPVVNHDFGHIARMGADFSSEGTRKSHRIYTDVPFKDSDCGAPIINNAKTVIGMVLGSDGKFSVAVPSTYILDALKTVKY